MSFTKRYHATTFTFVDDTVSSACIACVSFAAAALEEAVAVGRHDDVVVIDTCCIVIDGLEMKAERSPTRSIEIIGRVQIPSHNLGRGCSCLKELDVHCCHSIQCIARDCSPALRELHV
jgi:hypothetical protein